MSAMPSEQAQAAAPQPVDDGLPALMQRYCAGDAAAFHALYRAVAPRLLGYLIGLAGERATSEDVLQHTFLKVHQARGSYVLGADPVPWLYAIAHRTFLDETRRRKRSRVRLHEAGEAVPEPHADLSGKSADSEPERGQEPISAATLAALDRLPQNQREALMLTKVHGRSIAEAAAITGTTPGAVKLRAHRAYETLRNLLRRKVAP